MADILDGTGVVITDGDGASIFDGDGASSTVSLVTAMTSLDPYVKRIQRDIDVPYFVINPFLFEVFREFSEKTWLIYRSYEVQGYGASDSINNSVAFNVDDAAPGLVPIQIHKLKDTSKEYKAVRLEISGASSVTRSQYDIPGQKIYNFYAGDDESLDETYVRVFPFDYDPLLYMSIAFRTVDEPEEVPRIFLEFKEAICSGAMSRMMMQPKAEWYEPQLAMIHEKKYDRGVGQAKMRWFNSSSMVLGRRGFI